MMLEDNEVYKTLGWRKTFHELVMKPIGYLFSSRILRKAILNTLDVAGKRVIDVSCGDDYLPILLNKAGAAVTCNDLCPDSMKPLFKYKFLKFTNQDMMKVKARPKYDIVIFKNTFHHLKNVRQIKLALAALKRTGKEILIMDIDDPATNFLGKLWNDYYRIMLKDQGDMFIGYDQFKFHVNHAFKDYKITFKRIFTIKGYYMIAHITK